MLDPLTSRLAALVGGVVVFVLVILVAFAALGERAAKRSLGAMTAERDGLVTWGDKICGVVGEPFQVPERKEWGRNCFARIVTLQAFRTSSTDQTNQALVEHLEAQVAKGEADLARAKRDKELALLALDALAEEAARVPETNHVGPGYYGALNRTAGLRDAPNADAAR